MHIIKHNHKLVLIKSKCKQAINKINKQKKSNKKRMKFQQENQPQPQEIIQMDNEETELNPKSSKNIRHLQAIVDSIVIIVIYCISYLIENFQEPSILYFTCDQDVFYPYKQSK